MASHQELQIEWTMLDSNYNNWTVEDLQVAAELGRTLLERNEELENDVKTQQAIIDDQAQEIEFLTKQNSAMKEENATRAKFYEQLEATVFELERTNTTLSRKHESDKKRIQSLCENIDYLERKCEEMTGTLETIRDESKKHGAGKASRNSYWSSTGSDSSEDDSFIFYKRRSHSLHDLRDYTPSPDEFETHNSNSPDLKNSETEFIESLESKIEELISSKKKELDKVNQMEAQMRILLQENTNLQEQLNTVQSEKEEVISELRKQLLDTSNYAQQTLCTSSRLSLLARQEGNSGDLSSSSPFSLSSLSHLVSSNHNSDNNQDEDPLKSLTRRASAFLEYPDPTILCKRCSAEINLLTLVNSIETENDDPDENLDVGEFNSLEHELARATGNHALEGLTDKRSPKYANPERSDIFNWGLRRPSLLDFLFRGRDEEVAEEACEVQVDAATMNNSKMIHSRRIDGEDDEDACLRKDRQSEKEESVNDSISTHNAVKKLKLPVKIPFDEEDMVDSAVKHQTSSQLRLRSPANGRCGLVGGGYQLLCDNISKSPVILEEVGVISTQEHEADSKQSSVAPATPAIKKPSTSKQKTGFVAGRGGIGRSHHEDVSNILPPVSIYLTPAYEEDEESDEESLESSLRSFMRSAKEEIVYEQSSMDIHEEIPDQTIDLASCAEEMTSPSGGNFHVPEYKQILLKMFNLFQNSRRTYPVPVYPVMARAER